MKNKMIYLDITLETVGPLFVGAGKRYEKSEYILDAYGNICYIMDTLKMFNGLKKLNLLGEYEKWVLSEPKNVNLFNFIKENNIRAADYGKWAKYQFPVTNASALRNAEIMPFVKDAYNMPYIPGSSLKGAVRNAILNSELLDSDDMEDIASRTERSVDHFDNRKKKAYLAGEAAEIDTRLFHTLRRVDERGKEIKAGNAVNSVFQGFRISDSKPLPHNALGLYQKIDSLPDGNVRKLPILRECIKPGVKIAFTAEIDPNIFPYSPDDILHCIDEMYSNEQEKFLRHFPKMPVYSGNMIYVGGGSGYITKTAVYSLFKDKDRAVRNASVILDNTDSKNKGRKVGKHLDDPSKYGVSPRMRKITLSNGNKYEFGLCRIDFSEKDI